MATLAPASTPTLPVGGHFGTGVHHHRVEHFSSPRHGTTDLNFDIGQDFAVEVWRKWGVPINYEVDKDLEEFLLVAEFKRSQIRRTNESVSTILLAFFGGRASLFKVDRLKTGRSNSLSLPRKWVYLSSKGVTYPQVYLMLISCFGVMRIRILAGNKTNIFKRKRMNAPIFLVNTHKNLICKLLDLRRPIRIQLQGAMVHPLHVIVHPILHHRPLLDHRV